MPQDLAVLITNLFHIKVITDLGHIKVNYSNAVRFASS